MTPRDLFNVVLKILGLLFIKDLLTFIPQILVTFSFIFESNFSDIITALIVIVLLTILWFGVIYLFIFKTDFVINKLKLNKGFDQEIIPLTIHRAEILSAVFIIIGGLLLIHEIPNLIQQFFEYWRERKAGMIQARMSYSVLSASKIFIGLLLIIYQRHIVNFIEFKRKVKVQDDKNL